MTRRRRYDGDDPSFEDFGVRAALLAGMTVADAEACLAHVFPGRLGSAEAPAQVWARVASGRGRVTVEVNGREGGFVHEVALEAVRRGCPLALVVDGDDRSGSRWRAFTKYETAVSPVTALHDPTRGFELSRADMPAWLSAAAARLRLTGTLADYTVPWEDGGRDWMLREEGQTLPAPRLMTHAGATWGSAAAKPMLDLAMEWLAVLIALFFGVPALLAVPIFVFTAFAAWVGPGWLAAGLAALCCGAAGALVGLVPLDVPGGRVVPRRLTQSLLVVAEVVTPFLWYWRSR